MGGAALLAKLKKAVPAPVPESGHETSSKYDAWSYNGHYILGTKVGESISREDGLRAILESIASHKKYIAPLSCEPRSDPKEMKHVPKYMPPGSFIVFDSTPGPMGPCPVGALIKKEEA